MTAAYESGNKDHFEDKGLETNERGPSSGSRCAHGRQKYRCIDCGTGYCAHGRQKHHCRDCGAGYCAHGNYKYCCRDCGTGLCAHGRRKYRCRDCGTGYCTHGRQKGQCKDCKARKANEGRPEDAAEARKRKKARIDDNVVKLDAADVLNDMRRRGNEGRPPPRPSVPAVAPAERPGI
jgi:hypothetical protein